MLSPLISVIVPTRDRSESVSRLLRALSLQEPFDGGYEAVVVADGCSDGTVRQVTTASWPFDVHVLEQPSSGPSVARNCGAALARGEILLFLDDDVEPEPGLMHAHADFHDSQPHAIGLGYLPPVVGGDLFGITLRGWWESMFDGPRSIAHRYQYRDLLSGHFSIRRVDFQRLDRFDETLRCHEDWDLGARAIAAGLDLRLVPGAAAQHHDTTTLRKALRRKFEEGIADVQLAEKHPDLIPSMPMAWTGAAATTRSRLLRLAWDHPVAGDRLVGSLARLLAAYERWHLRFRWRALLERMLTYWYWRGVAERLGSRENLVSLLSRARVEPDAGLVVDLAAGIEAAAAIVDARRPRSLRLLHGTRHVGDIPAVPGAERLRSIHVRRALARELAPQFAAALAEQQPVIPAA